MYWWSNRTENTNDEVPQVDMSRKLGRWMDFHNDVIRINAVTTMLLDRELHFRKLMVDDGQRHFKAPASTLVNRFEENENLLLNTQKPLGF